MLEECSCCRALAMSAVDHPHDQGWVAERLSFWSCVGDMLYQYSHLDNGMGWEGRMSYTVLWHTVLGWVWPKCWFERPAADPSGHACGLIVLVSCPIAVATTLTSFITFAPLEMTLQLCRIKTNNCPLNYISGWVLLREVSIMARTTLWAIQQEL